MPTDRFYRLPEKKRKAIYRAVQEEFARVPFEKASINQIIRNAHISRGSFYTYFSDKQDAMEFVLNEDFTTMRQLCEDTLEANGGEYLNMLKVLFEYLVRRPRSIHEMMDMMRKIIVDSENPSLSECSLETVGMIRGGEEGRTTQWLVSRVDTGSLRIQTFQEIHAFLMLGAGAIVSSISQYYRHPEQLDQVRSQFESKLDILGYGVYQNMGSGSSRSAHPPR